MEVNIKKPTKSKNFSKNKGLRGEREARNLIESLTSFRLQRNTDQNEHGGYDLKVDLTGLKKDQKQLALVFDEFAWEIKNTKEGYVPAHMRQCQEQALKYGRTGVLFYKIPLKGWRVAIHIKDIADKLQIVYDYEEDEILHVLPQTFFKIFKLYNPIQK